jgi:aminoglycoside phosphotransferase (APT) family kinase protein
MRLALLEGISGSPIVARLISGSFSGWSQASDSAEALRDAILACARTAAMFHTSDIPAGAVRTLDDDVAALKGDLALVDRLSPRLGAILGEAIARIVEAAARTTVQTVSFSHGDFTHSQVLFDGYEIGVVDLDNFCRAEPALDLGQFTAYLRVAIRKAGRASSRSSEALSDELCDLFLRGYQAAARTSDGDRFAQRVALHEQVSLVRIVVRSWQQLKPARVENALAVLRDRGARGRLGE